MFVEIEENIKLVEALGRKYMKLVFQRDIIQKVHGLVWDLAHFAPSNNTLLDQFVEFWCVGQLHHC